MSGKSDLRSRIDIKNLLLAIAGNFLIAVSLENFAVYGNFPIVGFSGIALIIYRLTKFPIGAMILILNIPVAVICYKILGRRFLLRSLLCMVVQSVFIDFLCPLLPYYTGSRVLSALCCGALSGIGYGIIYKSGTSTGGVDFITMSIKAKKPHLAIGMMNFIADAFIVFLTGIIFKDVDGVIYGLLIAYITSSVIDRILFGANAGKLLLIVTTKAGAVSRRIDDAAQRGTTLIPSYGGYQHEEKDVVMCACSTRQVYPILDAVKEVDPASFSIILDSSEVHGEGFRYTGIGVTQSPDKDHE